MATKATRLSAVGIAAGLALLASCIDDEPPKVARVVVEASLAAPLTLIVSTNFLIRLNEQTNRRVAVPLKADTISLAGSHEQEFDIATLNRIYVLLKNDEATPHRVRLRVLLDGKEDYNASDELADEKTLEYFFVSTSSF